MDLGCDLVVHDLLRVLGEDVNAEFLQGGKSVVQQPWDEIAEIARRTTISSVCSSYTSLSVDSADNRSPLMKVPFDDLTSLMKTCETAQLINHLPARLRGQRHCMKAAVRTFPSSLHTSACARLRTFESKYPFVPFGMLLAFVCRPILTLVPGGSSEICLGVKVPLRGVRCRAGKTVEGVAWGSCEGG